MKKLFFELKLLCCLITVLLAGCEWNQAIDVELENHEKEVVVECYLEPGKPFRLVLSETADYLDKPSTPYIYDAEATITFNEEEITLTPNYVFIPESRKFFNFLAEDTVPELYNTEFHLSIKTRNKTITGTTKMIKPKMITNLNHSFNNQGKAYLNIAFEKDLHKSNFYRLVVNRDSLRGTNYTNLLFNDDISSGPAMKFSTGYDFSKEEKVVVTVYHVTEDYYNFLESVQNAVLANINPFSQPNAIISNVDGGVGIFTGLNYDRKEIIIKD